jgi:hypothetical protein
MHGAIQVEGFPCPGTKGHLREAVEGSLEEENVKVV